MAKHKMTKRDRKALIEVEKDKAYKRLSPKAKIGLDTLPKASRDAALLAAAQSKVAGETANSADLALYNSIAH